MGKNAILSEFLSRVPKRWIMLMLLAADTIAIIGTIYLAFSQLLSSNLLIFMFVMASIILSILLVIYSYFAFADVARERDQMRQELQELKEQTGFFFEPTGIGITTKAGLVVLNATFRANPSVIVDKLFLEIDDSRIAPSKGSTPFKVSPQYTNSWAFDLSDKIRDKIYIGKLIALVDKKEHESREFDVSI